ncbi:MAG: hypothetical protein DCF15_05090 [Phormidesmis priestleyi]|uniref:Uncharacterized protein n=1 Tax=Phormidesmis priestleyi TaxID=268141 RepID=A0A2W4XQN5_9CYAN|nr:MAG: hypothetical protein DCF15_05090 [Phormidesmis priestleyi]
MSVYRELAAELKANKAVIDSLNSRNQQLLQQNQFLKQEIHNVVQATLSLGQVAGVARQASKDSFPSAIAPDTLAKLVRGETSAAFQESTAQNAAQNAAQNKPQTDLQQLQSISEALPQIKAQARAAQLQSTQAHSTQAIPSARVPKPITQRSQPQRSEPSKPQAIAHSSAPTDATTAQRQGHTQGHTTVRSQPSKQSQSGKPSGKQPAFRRTEPISGKGAMVPTALPKLFTETSGEYRSSVLDSAENKEIGGVWLVLSIVLIIVTAFGSGFLIMKPLLKNR